MFRRSPAVWRLQGRRLGFFHVDQRLRFYQKQALTGPQLPIILLSVILTLMPILGINDAVLGAS